MQTIQNLEAVALSQSDLQRMLGPAAEWTNIMIYDELEHVKDARDLFPQKIKAVIILLQIEKPGASPVGHWIAMLDHGSQYEHFDSYGLDLDEELGITHEKPWLSDLFKKTGRKLVEASLRLQEVREHVNTCGRYAVVRCRIMGQLPEFYHFLRSGHSTPDRAITMLTALL